MKKQERLFFALLLAAILIMPAQGEEAASYHFDKTDFKENILGIYLESIPQNGKLLFKSRVLGPGSVLPADQLSQMCFLGETGGKREFSYLPVFPDRVGDTETAVFRASGGRNQAPVAENSAAETYKNLPCQGKMKSEDPEGEALSYQLIREPKRGTVTLEEDGTFLYTPKKNKVGEDFFTYQCTDPEGAVSREATVTITILKPSEEARYRDTMGLSCEFPARWLKNTGIFTGEKLGEDWLFQPEKPVNRGEFLTMLVKTLEIPPEEELQVMENLPRWLQPYAAAAARAGIPVDLTKDPMLPMTRKEAETVAERSGISIPESWNGEEAETLSRAEASELLYGLHMTME